MDVAVAGDSK